MDNPQNEDHKVVLFETFAPLKVHLMFTFRSPQPAARSPQINYYSTFCTSVHW